MQTLRPAAARTYSAAAKEVSVSLPAAQPLPEDPSRPLLPRQSVSFATVPVLVFAPPLYNLLTRALADYALVA
jgi:hypothetical protein